MENALPASFHFAAGRVRLSLRIDVCRDEKFPLEQAFVQRLRANRDSTAIDRHSLGDFVGCFRFKVETMFIYPADSCATRNIREIWEALLAPSKRFW